MATNKQLIKESLEISKELNLVVETEGLSNAQLAELLSDLKAKQKDANLVTGADTAVEVAVEVAIFAYSVAPGKAITTNRVIIADGDEIKISDLPGGKKAMDAFVKSGHVVKA